VNAEWLQSIDPVGVGDIASVLFFIVGRLSVSKPGIVIMQAAQTAVRIKRGR
jgi:hypothetical protein